MRQKKTVEIIVIFILISALLTGVAFLILKIKPQNRIVYSELTRNVGEDIPDISAFFKTGSNVDHGTMEFRNGKEKYDLVSLNKAGVYEVKITVGKQEYNSKLTVIDNEAPILKLKELTLIEKEKYLPISFIETCSDNSKEECKLSFKEESMSSIETTGVYEIEVIAKDNSGNETSAKTKLTLVKKGTSLPKEDSKPKTILKYTEEKSSKDSYCFGTKISTITTTGYQVYSDGTLEQVHENTEVVYDYSGYHASTEEILNSEDNDLITNKDQEDIFKMIELIAQYRAMKGVEITSNENILAASLVRAIEIAWSDKFSSTRPNGTSWQTVLSDLEVPCTKAEEILSSASSPEEAFQEIVSSRTNNTKLMDTEYRNFGIGKASVNNKTYWVIMLSN